MEELGRKQNAELFFFSIDLNNKTGASLLCLNMGMSAYFSEVDHFISACTASGIDSGINSDSILVISGHFSSLWG